MLKQQNPEFLFLPYDFTTGLKSDKPSTIQIKTIREARFLIFKKGKLFQWRRYYPNSKELYSENLNKTELTHENSVEMADTEQTTPKNYLPDFFKEGGLVFIRDPFDILVATKSNLGCSLFDGFYDNIKRLVIVSDLTLDDIADAYKTVHTN